MQTETMNSVQEIDTMSNISWATEKSMISNIEKARNCGLPPRSPPRSPSSQTTKYPIKTLCFSKKSLTMPTKEEYSILLTCGLGKRFLFCTFHQKHQNRIKFLLEYELIF